MNEYDNIDTKILDIESVNGEIIMKVFMCVEFFDYVINTKTKIVFEAGDATVHPEFDKLMYYH